MAGAADRGSHGRRPSLDRPPPSLGAWRRGAEAKRRAAPVQSGSRPAAGSSGPPCDARPRRRSDAPDDAMGGRRAARRPAAATPRPLSATAARGPGLCHRRPESRRADRTPAVRPASRGAGRPGWPDGAARRACLTGHSARRAGSTPRAPSDGPPRLVRSRAGPGDPCRVFTVHEKSRGRSRTRGSLDFCVLSGGRTLKVGKHGISSSELRRVRRARAGLQVGALCAVWGPGLDPLAGPRPAGADGRVW